MAEPTPPASQKKLESEPFESSSPAAPEASPRLPSYDRPLTKERKPPTITPRSFTRFFTPKSLSTKRIGSSRRALRELSASTTNSRSRRAFHPDSIGFDYASISSRATKRRKLRPISPGDGVELSSPIKRIRNQSLGVSDAEASEADSSGHDSDSSTYDPSRTATRKPRIDAVGSHLSRELYGPPMGRRVHQRFAGGDSSWQMETASFYSRPEDVYVSRHVGNGSESIPFCATACHTNSIMAIGDEDGGIRLLETDEGQKSSFKTPFLQFRPHQNAILDISFSPDDLLMATASGDQTSKVIDMPSQRSTHALAGHVSSVKQVSFQPGNSSVLATSSRDGSVQIWDLRCKGFDAPVQEFSVSLNPTSVQSISSKITYARTVNTIFDAHNKGQVATAPSGPPIYSSEFKPPSSFDAPSKGESPGRRGDVSVTALQFLPAGREHLLITGSEANASVKLWDLRTTHNHRRGRATPLSTTTQPESHNRYRHFGLSSLSLSGDASRLYALCRDNTVYAFATSHLILGSAPELSSSSKPRRTGGGKEKASLGPIYGFRHPSLHATTFYVKTDVRTAKDDKSEMLAIGSSDGTPILFPTDERYLRQQQQKKDNIQPTRVTRPALSRMNSFTSLGARLEDSIPIYQHGTPLVRGHSREVTAVAWAHGGDLISVSDDYTVRSWREGDQARELRTGGEAEGKRWGSGWAETSKHWDDDDG